MHPCWQQVMPSGHSTPVQHPVLSAVHLPEGQQWMPSGHGEPHTPGTPQHMLPGAQQAPPQQTLPGAQHAPPQRLDGGAQTHRPPWQTSLAAQAFRQLPQLAASLARSTHPVPHLVKPVGQVIVHPRHGRSYSSQVPPGGRRVQQISVHPVKDVSSWTHGPQVPHGSGENGKTCPG